LLLLSASFVLGVIAQQLKQSAILGYLVAGTILGPMLFSKQIVAGVAELGVSLLLFSIGLEFSFRRLKRLGAVALGGGTLQVTGTLALFALLALVVAPPVEALLMGAMVALSSTAVVLRILVDRAQIDSIHGRNALGILLLQDIAVVPMMLLVSMLGQGGNAADIGGKIMGTLVAAAGLMVAFYVLFYQLIPKFLQSRGHFANREMVLLLTIIVALGSTWAAHSLGISPAMGAFVAGMMIAESPFSVQIRSDIGSLRTLFVTLFFTSIGMVAEPAWFIRHAGSVFLIASVVFVGKTGIIFVICRLFRVPVLSALATGIALGQIGEFSFVLASTAHQGNLLGPEVFPMIVSVTILLMFLAPYMVAHAEPLAHFLLRLVKPGYQKLEIAAQGAVEQGHNIYIIGFGPAGREVANALVRQNMAPAVVELNPRGAQAAREMGLEVHLGDARSQEVLEHSGMASTCMVVVTVPDPRTAEDTVKSVRQVAPGAAIVARSRYNVASVELSKAGADLVVDEETMVGRELAREIRSMMEGDSAMALACSLAGSATAAENRVDRA
jgi:CPA2 family monovalent cation:H+ antiporter-2